MRTGGGGGSGGGAGGAAAAAVGSNDTEFIVPRKIRRDNMARMCVRRKQLF